MSLAKKWKIPGRYRIQRVFEKGGRVPGKIFSLRYYPNRAGPRFAVISPVKLKIGPVKRNRLRRRLFEAIRISGVDFHKGKQYDIVVVSHNGVIADMPPEELSHEFLKLYLRI